MTNDDNEHSADINIEVPAGRLTFTGYPAKILVEASATAVQSLSTATELASSTGYDEIATTGHALKGSLQSIFNITDSNVTIYQIENVNINQETIIEIQNQINDYTTTLEANNVPFFDCKDAYDQCMSGATDALQRLHCRVLYSGCLGDRATSTIKSFIK